MLFNNSNNRNERQPNITDHGPEPYVTNLDITVQQNQNFRAANWTGTHLQQTLMSIPSEIGLEMHNDLDQFLYIVRGYGRVIMGKSKDNLNYQVDVGKGYGIFIPAGTWHNLVNRGNTPIKLFSIYAPPEHPRGTIHKTKEESDAAEAHQAQ